jgi:tetratricopeptide (TPR) repeat protein
MDWEINRTDLIKVAWALYEQGDFPKALQVWKSIRKLFPCEPEVYRGSALAHKQMGDYESADMALHEGATLHPSNRTLSADYAHLAQDQRNWAAAFERWESYSTRFPGDAFGFVGASIALRELQRYDEAEQILLAALDAHPDNSQLLANRAYVAQQRGDWARALAHWNVFRGKVPDDPVGYASTGAALLELQRFEQADAVLEEGLRRFPNHQQLVGNYAWVATRMRDLPEALKRWSKYRDQFPTDSLGHGQTKWVLNELGRFEEASRLASSARSSDESALEVGPLMLGFESLGDNCEFGVVQRHYGAEPLGLLRFTSTPSKLLMMALDSGFVGVGDPGNTVLTTFNGEYVTSDKRYHMSMHTFIPDKGDDRDKRFVSVCRRIRFLRDKLLQDLKDAEKIFVYSCREGLGDSEIRELWSALRRHGDNRLLFVRSVADRSAAGSVRLLENSLAVGFIDKLAVDGPSFEIWLQLCRQASLLLGQHSRQSAEPMCA